MVTLNPFKKKGQKGTASPEKAENDEFTEDIKGMPSNSTVNTEESSPQSPVPGSAASTSGKSKSKRRNSSGTIKKSSREGRSADDSSVKRSKSKTRSKKSDDGAAEDSGNSPTRKKKKKKDKEKSSADSGYSSDSGLKSIKNKKKKSKKDKKNKSTSSKDGDESRDNSLKGSGSDPETESSPKRSPTTAAKVPKVAAAGIVASFEVASPKPMEPTPAKSAAPTPRQVTPPPVGTSKSGRDEEQVKKSTTSSPKRPSSSTQPTKANSTGSSPKLDRQGSSSVQDRASIFKKENGAAPIAPGQHLEGSTATAERKSVVTTGGPRRMPKGGSQQLAGVDDQENATEQQVNKPRSSSVGKYAPTTRRSEKKTTDTAKEDGSSGVKNAMNVFEGGKVRRSVAPKQKSLDVGKLRTAYLKQEDNTKKAEASASLTAPSLGKDTNNGPAMKRSTSGGNVRNAYLKKLGSSGGDDSAATEESSSPSKPGVGRPSQNTPWSLAKSLGLSSSATSSANNNKNNSLPSSSTAAAAAAVANDKPPGPGSIKSAYLNATQNSTSPPRPDRARANSSDDGAPGKVKLNAFAMFDPSLKKEQDAESKEPELTASEKRANTVKNLIATQGKSQEERQGRDKQINTGGKRRSSSAGTVGRIKNNPARALLEAQFGGGKASQTTGTIGQRADAFSAKHGSSSKTMDEVSTPKAVRRVMNLNALNLATPGRSTKKPTGPKRKDMKKLLSQGDADASFADTVAPLLRDRKQKPLVRELCDRIQKADGVPQTRRLSMRDNDLIVSMIGAIQNDPDVKSIIVDGDVAFNTVGTTLLFGFVEALGMNMHLRRLTFKNVQLGNDILYALATAMERNFILEEIDLSWNLFTSEGLSNFCQSLASSNETCKKIMLNNQTTPISEASEEDVLEAFGENKRIMYAKVDFSSDDGQDKLNKILYRNKRNPPGPVDRDKKIIEILSFQAERAEAIKEQKDAENKPLEVPEDDWDYLYELAVLFDKYKLKDIVESENNDKDKKAKPKNADSMGKGAKSNFLFGQFKDILDDSLGCFNSDGSFLTAEFISKYLKKTQDTEELVFDFHGQWKLFKRFPVTDPARELIVTKFVDAIVSHPQMKEFMGINMANTGCGDDFLEKLAERCLADHSLLPNMHVINFETNFINERGCVALSKIIASPTCMKYLQLVRLENQKGLLTSKAEFNICRAMFVNRSVVVVSLQFRGLMERQQIHAYVSRNVDFLRQARQRHYKKTGTGRKRNETELFFDKIASNNGLVKEVKLPGDRKFLSLSAEERVKAAQAFAENTHITNVNLNGCELDDAFAEAMGKSLETNMAIEKLSLESNSISGTGIKYLLEGLAKNTTLKELRLHKQSKNVATAEEDGLADTLEANESLTKLGLDFRNQAVQVQVDRKLKMNDQLKRSKDSSDNLNYLFT